MSLLEVRELSVGIRGRDESLLRDVSLAIEPGEVVGLVGESGSGKTMASLALMGLLPPVAERRSGTAVLDGRPLLADQSHGGPVASGMSMIFQNPMGALNPTMRVGAQIARVLHYVQGRSRSDARAESIEMMKQVGIPGADRVARSYPHQLSGGMCQRIMIAMALACRPRVLIADEPTTALDVTVQAQIFDLIRDLVEQTQCGVLFITHDLGAVAEVCDRVVVLYGGQVMEVADTVELYEHHEHPYTRFLFESVEQDVDPLSDDAGPDHSLQGCRFAHRCPHAWDRCQQVPPLVDLGTPGHQAACFLEVGELRGTA